MDKKIMNEVNRLLAENHYTPTIPVVIYGNHYDLSEVQVRALQVIARNKFLQSKDDFEEFNMNVFIPMLDLSSEDAKVKLQNNMFQTTGRLVSFFEAGFYDVSSRLALSLSRSERTGEDIKFNWKGVEEITTL